MKHLVFYIVLSCFLTGCFGGQYLGEESLETDKFKLREYRGGVWFLDETSLVQFVPYKNGIEKKDFEKDENGKITIYSYSIPHTKEAVLKYWGKPDKVEHAGAIEGWVYEGESLWKGVILGVVVPIPLMLPVDTKDIAITFKNNIAISIKKEIRKTYGVMCVPTTLDWSYNCE